ncbi:MAG TPA: hypothetical protein VG713_06885 [Pirellulales bacterium]|nr:hypothetical protein [Pirellulales bacterium]
MALLAYWGLAGAATSSKAAPVVFSLDSAQSTITLSVQAEGGTVVSTAQTPGSDTTSLSGTFDIDLEPGSIQFLSTNDTHFALQSVPQAPLANASPGTAPAQYGLSIALSGIATGVVAARDYVADATSGVLPLANGAFDATGVSLGVSAGTTSYNLVVLGSPLVGTFGDLIPVPNQLPGGTLTRSGDVYTLTAPILAMGSIDANGIALFDVFTGQVVATAVVPEPSSLLLATSIIVPLLELGRRRRRC